MEKITLIFSCLLFYYGTAYSQFHQGYCSVYINSRPSGANILIDNIPTDRQTPAMITGLAAGPHLILLEWGEYTAEKKVVLEEGVFTRHELTLKLKPVKILIESTPDSAVVILGSREIGATPILAQQDNPGSFKINLSKQGYMPLDTIVYYPDRKQYNLNLTLQPAGLLSVESQPPGADVFLDQRFLGRSPLETPVQAGEHGIQVMTGDYQDFHKVVTVAPGERIEVKAVLEKMLGRLTIKGLPDGASIFLDQKFLGYTPILNFPVAVGEHQIRFAMAGFVNTNETYSVTVIQDMEAELVIEAQMKSSLSAAWRSAVFPGWGQYYSERKNWAYAYIAGEIVLITAVISTSALYSQSIDNYQSARTDYLSQVEESDVISCREIMLDRYDEVKQYERLAKGLAYGAAGFWALNILDAYIWHQFPPRNDQFSFGLNADDSSPRLTIYWRF